mmetsp:Transcript_30285/g.62397  ORF Transcript_30285/g.62397 Transcript_30285/m.62397 type:complete len:629 (+) Transcript_30285:1137-3023(+)
MSFKAIQLEPTKHNVSIRQALKECFPNAISCKDLTHTASSTAKTVKPRVTRSTRQNAEVAAIATQTNNTHIKSPVIPMRNKCRLSALVAFAAVLMVNSQQYEHGYVSQLAELEPKTQAEARKSPQADKWKQAEHIELKTIWDMGTFKVVDRPPHVIPLPSRFTYRLKRDRNGNISKFKARLVARGDLQTPDEYTTTYAPTSRFTAIHTIIAIATQENMYLKHWDITGAFMTADIDTDIYIDLPPGYALPDGKCIRLSKSLYGLRQSPGLFHSHLEKHLLDYGFEPVGADRVIFRYTRGQETILLSLYVDDRLCATNSLALYDEFLANLRTRFDLSNQGDLTWYLGVDIRHDREHGVTTLCQLQFVDAILERFNMKGCTPIATPAEPNTHLLKSDQPGVPNKEAVKAYQQMVGSLMYLACFTRPDIAYAVNQCAKYMSNPGPSHVAAAKRILKYLQGTKTKGLTYTRTDDTSRANVLTSYADSDHAGDPDSRRSVTCYVNLLNGAAVSWQSVRQQVVALSSAEAEYYAASVAGTDVQYVRRLTEELGYAQPGATVLYEDNMACIYMSESAAMYHKARHIDTRVYHLRELCKEGSLKLVKVESARQAADSLTKGTPRPLFEAHRRVMMGG